MAYLLGHEHWNRGYGSEAALAVARGLLPILKSNGFRVEDNTLDGITATARPDNPASGKILAKAGLGVVSEEEKFGALRQHYRGAVTLPPASGSWEVLSFGSDSVFREQQTVRSVKNESLP